MPVYLLHGFRWPRPLIRIHIILQNLDDAAADWIVAPDSQRALLHNLRKIHPEPMASLPDLRFIEQFDPADLSAVEQPYAYVADFVEEIRLGIDVDEVRGKGIANEQWSAIMELRDKLAADEKVGWYVVVCGDEARGSASAASSAAAAGTQESETEKSDSSAQQTGQSSSEGEGPSPTGPKDQNDEVCYASAGEIDVEEWKWLTEWRQQKRGGDPVEQKGLKKFWNAARLGRRKRSVKWSREVSEAGSDILTQNAFFSRPNMANELAASSGAPILPPLNADAQQSLGTA